MGKPTPTMAATKRTRKIPMAKREDKKKVSVSFTKRRQGLFNKAAELTLLCDAQVAVLVDSPSSKPKRKSYSFGHPSVGAVLDAYINGRVPAAPIDSNGTDKQSVLSLLDEIKALEAEVTTTTATNNNNGKKAQGFSLGLESFEKSKSVKELQLLVDGLQKLMDKAKCRINNSSAIIIANDDNNNGFLDDDSPINGLYTAPSSSHQPAYVSSYYTSINHASPTSNIALQGTTCDYDYYTNGVLQTGNNGNDFCLLPESASCFNSSDILNKDNEAGSNFITDLAPNYFGYDDYNHDFVIGGNNNSWIDNDFGLWDVTEDHGINNVSPLDLDGIGTLNTAQQMLPGAYGKEDFPLIGADYDWLWQ